MSNLYSFAIGVGSKNSKGEWLEVFYPQPLLHPEQTLRDIFAVTLGLTDGDMEPSVEQLAALQSALKQNGYSDLAESVASMAASSRPVVAVAFAENTAPTTVPQGYLKAASAVTPTG